MLIVNGIVHTMDGPVIENGYVAISGSKIVQAGPMEEHPQKWEGERLDAQGGHVCPGFIDVH